MFPNVWLISNDRKPINLLFGFHSVDHFSRDWFIGNNTHLVKFTLTGSENISSYKGVSVETL